MYYHRVYGLTIASDLFLENVKTIEPLTTTDVVIKEEIIDPKLFIITKEEKSSKADFFYICKGQWACVRNANNGVFVIENGRTINYSLIDGYDIVNVRQLVLFICMMIIRAQRGIISVHGSCVVVNNNAYIISGKSGSGKSTFTTELLHHGIQFMSDDICAVRFENDIPYIQPALPERKLCEDAVIQDGYDTSKLQKLDNMEKEKFLLCQEELFYDSEMKLAGVIIINECECNAVNIERIVGGEVFKSMCDNLIYSSLFDDVGNTSELYIQAMKIAKQIPVFRLNRPKGRESRTDMYTVFQSEILE